MLTIVKARFLGRTSLSTSFKSYYTSEVWSVLALPEAILRMGFVKGVIVPRLGFSCHSHWFPSTLSVFLSNFTQHYCPGFFFVPRTFLSCWKTLHLPRGLLFHQRGLPWKRSGNLSHQLSTFQEAAPSHGSGLCLNITALRNHTQPPTSNTSSTTHPVTVLMLVGNYCAPYLLSPQQERKPQANRCMLVYSQCLANCLSTISSVQSLSCVWLFVTPWTTAHQASLSVTNFWSPSIPMPTESVMPSNHLILCHPLLLLPSIFPNIRVFSNESALHITWPKYWSFSFNVSLSNKHPGLISFRMDWLDLLAVLGTLKSLLQHHSSKASILQPSVFFIVQLSHLYMTTGKTIALTRWTFVGKVMNVSAF